MKENIKKFEELIKNSNKILLVNHIRMDPDWYWSLWAFYYVLKKLWKIVKATNDEKAPKDFIFSWKDEIIEPSLNIKKFNPDLIITFDSASLDQLWFIYKNNMDIFEKSNFVVIDHHISNKWFWTVNLIDPKSSSTCELLYEILILINYKKFITPFIASHLIMWIITDTNIFYNTNTTSKTLKIASELLDLWANIRYPIYEFYRKKTFNKTKLWWEVLKDIKKSNDWKIIWATIKKEVFNKTNTSDKETTGLINEFLANMAWSEISFLLYELEADKVKASFRSSAFDVSKLCSDFWGWWHKQAAWFTSDKSIDIVEKEILERLSKSFQINQN